MPSAKRHDLSELPYSPTIWQRIGGPWSITLRAYLWSAPLGILAQPVVEQSFWDNYGTWSSWLLISTLGYLAFGLVLWLGWLALFSQRKKANSSALLVISIAVAASMFRSATIGLSLEPFGLTGVGWIARLPFGAFLGFAWVFTSALIMDSKYRYQLHLETLLTEQQNLLRRHRQWLGQIRNQMANSTRIEIEDSHRSLHQAMREIASLTNDSNSVWVNVMPEIKRASIRMVLADEKEVWTSEKDLNELQGSRAKAFAAITTTPLMNLPLVMTFTAIIAFLGTSRLYSIPFSIAAIAYGVALHAVIIQFFKFLISRNYSPSSFRYFLMTGVLLVTSLLSTAIASPLDYDLLILRTIALTATVFEIVWLIATGFIQFGQIQRQTIIEAARSENERLQISSDFWQTNFVDVPVDEVRNAFPLITVADALKKAVSTEDLNLGLAAMEFSNNYFMEFADDFLGHDDLDIESELKRISNTWAEQAEIIWSVSGGQVDLPLERQVVAALEVCVSKAIRHGRASVISIDVNRLGNLVAAKVSDNGQDYIEGGSGLGIEILDELTNNTWQRDRSGGLNIVTAQFA